jgi:hypothetical protein
MDWTGARVAILAEMNRKKLSKRSVALAAGLPTSTVYTALGRNVRGRQTTQCDFETAARLVKAVGKTLAWLERACAAGRKKPVDPTAAAR